jgi:hypothetical protein
MRNTTSQSRSESTSQRIFITNDQGITEAQAVVIVNQDGNETIQYSTTTNVNVVVNQNSVNGTVVSRSSRSVARAIAQ